MRKHSQAMISEMKKKLKFAYTAALRRLLAKQTSEKLASTKMSPV